MEIKERKTLSLIALCTIVHVVNATCEYPTLTNKQYALTKNKTSYAEGETFEVNCKPAYKQSGESMLSCQTEGTWDPSTPGCLSVGVAPWWALFAGVWLGIIIIACTCPRLYFCFCGDPDSTNTVVPEKKLLKVDENFQKHNFDEDFKRRQELAHWTGGAAKVKQAEEAGKNMAF